MTEEERLAWGKSVPSLKLEIQGLERPLYVSPKLFKSGSVGWYLSEKITLSDTRIQVSVCMTVVKSKREAQPSVNGNTPYPEGFQPAQDLREAAEEGLTPAEGVRKPRRGKNKP